MHASTTLFPRPHCTDTTHDPNKNAIRKEKDRSSPKGGPPQNPKTTHATTNAHTYSPFFLYLSLSHTHTPNELHTFTAATILPRLRSSGTYFLKGDKNHDRKVVVVGIHPSKRNPGPPPRQNEPERLLGKLAHSHFQKWPQNTLALSCLPVTLHPQLLAYTHFGRGISRSTPPPRLPPPLWLFPQGSLSLSAATAAAAAGDRASAS